MSSRLYFLLLQIGLVLTIPAIVSAQSTFPDLNGDNRIDFKDVNILTSSFSQYTIYTFNRLVAFYGQSATSPTNTPVPTSGPSPTPIPTVPGEWTQFGHDAQRTNFTTQTVATPWRYKWQWNGADANGQPQTASHLSVAALVQPITGGGRIYIATTGGFYALNPTNGSEIWSNKLLGTLSATAAYDPTGYVYVPSGNNNLYKLNAANGSVAGTYTATSALNLAPLLVGSNLYIVAVDGTLTAVNTTNMSKIWSYSAGSNSATPVAYTPARSLLIYLTQDLAVHAVNLADGTRKWRVIPTTRTPGNPGSSPTNDYAESVNGWPVIAEQHGLVFVRYRLDWESLWYYKDSGSSSTSQFPTTNSGIRSYLTSFPKQQALFALNLDNGSVAFVPAVGNGGAGDGGNLPMGPQPVIKITADNKEVAYIIWRNGLTCASIGYCDGRNDATFGEMVLDSTTVPGYVAGDMRFVGNRIFSSGNNNIQTDEMMQLTMSGNVLFHSHWLISQNNVIGDRSANFGNTFNNSIMTTPIYDVIWRQASGQSCTFNAATRYCSNHLYSYGDTRYYDSPGFYEYWDAQNGGSRASSIVSSGLVIVKMADGGVMALENGNPLAQTQKLVPVLGATSEIPTVNYSDALKYLDQTITTTGTIKSTVDHLPKAIYLGFIDPHDGALLVRIFNKDLSKFDYDPMTLLGKKIAVTGKVTLYWPDSVDPEIIVTDPSQIRLY